MAGTARTTAAAETNAPATATDNPRFRRHIYPSYGGANAAIEASTVGWFNQLPAATYSGPIPTAARILHP